MRSYRVQELDEYTLRVKVSMSYDKPIDIEALSNKLLELRCVEKVEMDQVGCRHVSNIIYTS